MSTAEVPSASAPSDANDLKLEVVVIPVSDVDRAKKFYANLGWRLDADFPFDNGFRVVQFTPPGSSASVQFGENMTSAPPGSARGLYLIVSDIEGAHDELARRGVEISEVFHPGAPGAQFQTDGSGRLAGPATDHETYSSFATFSDPDGNTWLLQEITTRLPGRVEATETSFGSVADLAGALRRAKAAHGEHEKRTGQPDPDWPDWYAAYIVAEQAGEQLPNVSPFPSSPTPTSSGTSRRSIHLVEKKRFISHAEAARVLRRVGYSQQQIEDVLRDLPDPIDAERDGETLLKQGISAGSLMDRMSGSP